MAKPIQVKISIFWIFLTLGFFLVIGGGLLFLYSQDEIGSHPDKEVEETMKKISRLILLPEGETPVLATVSDKEKLKNYPFFTQAENGDQVLIYVAAKKAILYRPSIEKVIDVAPVKTEGETSQLGEISNSTPTISSPTIGQTEVKIKMALYNGTNDDSLLTEVEKKVEDNLEEIEISQKSQPKKEDYQKTILVDISEKYGGILSSIARFLGAEISTLPDGEETPEADLLLIVGKDRE